MQMRFVGIPQERYPFVSYKNPRLIVEIWPDALVPHYPTKVN